MQLEICCRLGNTYISYIELISFSLWNFNDILRSFHRANQLNVLWAQHVNGICWMCHSVQLGIHHLIQLFFVIIFYLLNHSLQSPPSQRRSNSSFHFFFQAKPTVASSSMMYHRDTSHIPSAALLGGATLGEEKTRFIFNFTLTWRHSEARRLRETPGWRHWNQMTREAYLLLPISYYVLSIARFAHRWRS